MAWIAGGYYRYKKIAGRSHTIYIGTGKVAEAAAALDAQRLAEREAKWAANRQAHADHQQAFTPLANLCDVAELLARSHLTAAGYHQQDRHQWRKKQYAPKS